MDEFSTTLLREKFIIRDPLPVSDDAPVIALSNRIVVPLPLKATDEPETFVVRAQNMHSCTRMAGRLLHSAQTEGPVHNRSHPYDWEMVWKEVTDAFERKYNENRWIAVYYRGKPVYQQGVHHPFLDIIEACDSRSEQEYGQTVEIAEGAFKQAGKVVKIEHDANVALVVSVRPDLGRCGIILRGADKTTTFNFTAKPMGGRPVKPSQCLSVSAAFLEGIQLSFQVGMGKEKLRHGLIERKSDAAKQIEEGEKRLARLMSGIRQFEQLSDVTYRPERPDFFKMLDDAQDVAKKILAPQIAARIASGDLDEKDWVV